MPFLVASFPALFTYKSSFLLRSPTSPSSSSSHSRDRTPVAVSNSAIMECLLYADWPPLATPQPSPLHSCKSHESSLDQPFHPDTGEESLQEQTMAHTAEMCVQENNDGNALDAILLSFKVC
jgi:hypothetical protein